MRMTPLLGAATACAAVALITPASFGQTLFSFEDGTTQGFARTGGDNAALTVSNVSGFGATDGTQALSLQRNSGGTFQFIQADVPEADRSIVFDGVANGSSLAVDVSLADPFNGTFLLVELATNSNSNGFERSPAFNITDLIVAGGTTTISAPLNSFSTASSSDAFLQSVFSINTDATTPILFDNIRVIPVPEPTGLAFAAAALGVPMLRRRRR